MWTEVSSQYFSHVGAYGTKSFQEKASHTNPVTYTEKDKVQQSICECSCVFRLARSRLQLSQPSCSVEFEGPQYECLSAALGAPDAVSLPARSTPTQHC